MSAPATIQFKRTIEQFVREYLWQVRLIRLGKTIVYLVFGLSILALAMHIVVALNFGEWPIFSLYNGRLISRIVWFMAMICVGAWYLYQEIKRRQSYTSRDDIYAYLDTYAKGFVVQLYLFSQRSHQPVDAYDVLGIMMHSAFIKKILNKLEIDTDKVLPQVEQLVSAHQAGRSGQPSGVFDETLKGYMQVSAERALARGDVAWGLADLLMTLLEKEPPIAQVFDKIDVTPERIAAVLGWISGRDHLVQAYTALKDQRMHTGPVNRAWTSVPTPILDHYGRDLTITASYGGVPLISVREVVVEEAVRVLSRTTKNSVLLVGEPGVGKTTVVQRIALRLLSGQIPPSMQDKRLVQLDTASLHADSRGFGVVFSQLVAEAERAGNVILYIPELQDLASEHTEGVAGVELLLPILEHGRMQIIGATTVKEYHTNIEQSSSFASSFGVIEVSEMNEADTLTVLGEVALEIEAKHHVTLSLKAMQAAVTLSSQYIHDRVLPEKAIELIDEAAAYASEAKKTQVTEEDVRHVLSQDTKVPLTQVQSSEQDLLLHLEDELHKRVIGQVEAVNAVAESLRRARAGLGDKNRPIGVFLFVGPTGVGKTELAKALASIYFQSEANMIRLDMSEYQDVDAVEKLIGKADQEGLLTAPVRTNPFALVLLDEFEKSSAQIRNLFLQVFDDGRMTDGSGRVIDFKNTIIIATSNAGSLDIQDAEKSGSTYDQIKGMLISSILPKLYTPELLNRFDGVVVFRALSESEIVQIAHLEIDHVSQRILESSGVHLTVLPDALAALAHAGFDPTLGGRPLRRVIQDRLEAPLAKKLLAGGLHRGDTAVITLADVGLEAPSGSVQ